MKDKWEEWDDDMIIKDWHLGNVRSLNEISKDSREAYKAELRAEIEKRKKWFEDECAPSYHGRNFKLAELNHIIDLLDTIEPPQ